MKRFAAFMAILISMTVFTFGCEWAGRMVAKTEQGIETGVEKADQGIKNMQKQFEKGKNEAENDD